jgi:hypothetical protein
MQIASADAAAFDLFFRELDFVMNCSSEAPVIEPPIVTGRRQSASWFLNTIMADRPAMYLSQVTVGALRAALDGYMLAAWEEEDLEAADLEGFEHWVRRKFSLKGLFRWENIVLVRLASREPEAYRWAIDELNAYRSSKSI